MTPTELQAIEARAEAATEGPWEVGGPWPRITVWHTEDIDETGAACGQQIADLGERYPAPKNVTDDPNATFIAHARQDIPALVKEVRRLQELSRVQTRALLANEHKTDQNDDRVCCATWTEKAHRVGCPVDAALSAAGLSTQAQRDEAREK